MNRSRISFGSRGSSIEEPTVNLTPLIDVVFVILIMFILIAPLLQLDRIKLAEAPQIALKDATAVRESSPIAIHVRSDNSIWFQEKEVDRLGLREELIQAHQRHPHASPQLFQDHNASFGTYQSVKNAAEEAGFTEMDIILKPT